MMVVPLPSRPTTRSRSAEQLRAFAHPENTVVDVVWMARYEANTVVADREYHLAGSNPQHDLDLGCPRVPADVGQRFLSDSVELGLDPKGKVDCPVRFLPNSDSGSRR